MQRYYVNISGITQEFLDFLGYIVICENEEFKILSNKGTLHIVDKSRPRLYVDDKNDAGLLGGPFAHREKMPFPPQEIEKTDRAEIAKKVKKDKKKDG
jgi:hypothetical protein